MNNDLPNVLIVRDYLQSRMKIHAIKYVKSVTGWGLKASKDYVEAIDRTLDSDPYYATPTKVTATITNKENTMNTFNNLILRSEKVDEDLTTFVPDAASPLGAAMLAAKEEQKQQEAERCKKELVAVLDRMVQYRQERVQMIRNLRKREKEEKEKLVALDRAFQYAEEVGDFRPLLGRLNLIYHTTEVPADWQPGKKAKK